MTMVVMVERGRCLYMGYHRHTGSWSTFRTNGSWDRRDGAASGRKKAIYMRSHIPSRGPTWGTSARQSVYIIRAFPNVLRGQRLRPDEASGCGP